MMIAAFYLSTQSNYMGKKAKFKKIRRLASQMPEIPIKHVRGTVVSGMDAIKQGIKEIEGRPVEQLKSYRKKEVVPATLNHNRKMKQLYNKHGLLGVVMYRNAVNRYVSSQKAKEANA